MNMKKNKLKLNRKGLKMDDVFHYVKEIHDTAVVSSEFLKLIWEAENVPFLTKFLEQNLIMSLKTGKGGKDKKYIIPGSIRSHIGNSRNEELFKGHFAEFDFKDQLTLGVYERLVCQILQAIVKSAPDSQESELYFGFSRHYWGKEFQFILHRSPGTIRVKVEKSTNAPISCIKRLKKMLAKVQELIGEGLKYELKVRNADEQMVDFNTIVESKDEMWNTPI